MKSIIDKLKGIQHKATYGLPEERRAAAIELKRLLKKYGLTTADLTGDEKKIHAFKIRNDGEKELIIQIVGMTLGAQVVGFKQNDGKVFFELTKIQGINASELYSHFRAGLRREVKEKLEAIRMAFFLKHGLMNTPSDDPLNIELLNSLMEKNNGMV